MKHYYRCRSNPNAPLLVLDTDWEVREMRQNREYDQVDADGLPVIDEDELAEKNTIPFSTGTLNR